MEVVLGCRRQLTDGLLSHPFAQPIDQSLLVSSGLALAQGAAQTRPHQKIGDASVAGNARAALRLCSGPGEPFLLSRIKIIRRQPWRPVSAVTPNSGQNENGNIAGKHI